MENLYRSKAGFEWVHSPFGMPLVGRTWGSEEYRYGFNGKENTDEVYGDDNAVDFGARIYDSRLGRFLSLDLKSKIFSFSTPYSYAMNKPIAFIDDGNSPIVRFCSYEITHANGKTIIKVILEVELNVAVINLSSTILTQSEGSRIANSLNSEAVEGNFTGTVTGLIAEQFAQEFVKLSGKDSKNAEIQYEMNLEQNFRYVSNVSEIKEGEEILALSNSINDSDGAGVGGIAMATDGVCFANINDGVCADLIFVNSTQRTLRQGNVGNHEAVHDLGGDDDYDIVSGEAIGGANLMGGNNGLYNLEQFQINQIAESALQDLSIFKMQNKSNMSDKIKNSKLTGYKGGSLVPQYEGRTAKERLIDGKMKGGVQTISL